jgi:hypothetical protein
LRLLQCHCSLFIAPLSDLAVSVQLVTGCVTLVYGYMAALPWVMWAGVKYFLQIHRLGVTQLACVVGYSLLLWLPAACASTANSLAWPALMVSCGASTLFLLRSLKPVLEPQREKGASLIGALVLIQFAFMLVLKFQFYSNSDTGGTDGRVSKTAAAPTSSEVQVLEGAS